MLVERLRDDILSVNSNTYIGIGRPIRWGDDSNELASEIEDAAFTINYQNQLHRDLIAIKKIQTADLTLVVPRVDWETGTTYDEYQDHYELYTHNSTSTLGNGSVSAAETEVTETESGLFASVGLDVGQIIRIQNEVKEVVDIDSGSGVLNVNTSFASTYTNTSIIRISNNYPKFANSFYVRNTKDQVFKCLHNNNTESTTEPTIDLDGQLPENPFIITADGYKWKYLYTIPYGLKQKFFTKTWMPVLSDSSVVATTVDGRIDMIDIVDGGDGYFLNSQSGNSNSLPIITISGDGTGANVTAKVESGVITDLNILSGGSGYTNAIAVAVDSDQLSTGNAAVFDVVIGPKGGHGSDPARELGCYSLMIAVELNSTENGNIPVANNDSDVVDYRQISVIRNPLLSNGEYANSSVYRSTYKFAQTSAGAAAYNNDELVYIGSSLESSSFIATVVYWDGTNNLLYLNNLIGESSVGEQLTGVDSAVSTTILSIDEPLIEPYSGDILYIENRAKILRSNNQTEQVRLTLSI